MNNASCVEDIRGNAMALPLKDKSEYFKGLLVLSRRDRVINDEERDLLIKIGGILDFDKRFCEATIDDLLMNTNISRDPIVFSDENLKVCFFRDALRMALSDGDLHPAEYRWLRQTAHANGWSKQKLDKIIREFKAKGIEKARSASFAIQKLL
jgi:hypothetical protein